MLYSLTGELTVTENNQVAVDCQGVAYLCNVSFNTLRELGPLGSKVTLYTYLKITQDAADLYGFFSKDELDAFKMLTSVSGVGPKVGLSILSALTPSQLFLAIASGDAKAITAAQGVGPKVGQRIVLELRDKVAKISDSADILSAASTTAASVGRSSVAEAVSALVMLGYSQSEAAIAVGKCDQTADTETIIKQALKQFI
ncbi:MAG: Holliday junction branch migration protein RuvA [Ruminococcaceae bacterium]|nr:Holliday junction branch migration protein RuvA [Oscillospiraceae bacterium]